uniref:Mucosa-associated lymphoid tissue lymphoma translocation protein 1-like isoform X1 n=1 Tax=Geotrypetes seraphini TaxID=260995 RepID=A0A6P8PN23_GEOSA|nr:mucosa-associated lymphoid tissue lymphoma translocation protein 1-like isoform X1 [Geotrypetes seraphini]XP_033776906.1 mucosa-associated lymphoid tissue lymphoma translocation protein 1-like isoform X1 [Geotrypetes seraphini]
MLKEILITEHPVSACVPAGYPLTLRCRAEGPPSLQFQWFQQAKFPCCQIPGATQPDLFVVAQETQLYICRVHDQHNNSKFSQWVKVKVLQNVAKDLLPVRWKGEPILAVNPKRATVKARKQVVLKCLAFGIPAPDYQWYHNGNHLHCGKKKAELTIKAEKVSENGSYLCCATNEKGEQWSHPVEVTIVEDIILRPSLQPPLSSDPSVEKTLELPRKNSNEKEPDHKVPFYATDKVALLVGNNRYQSHPSLLAPMMDVFELTLLLRQLNFRVVSLLDLTKSEMLTAVNQFLQLLGKGVYGLFYYAGHGYERSGRNYMVPIDAPQPYRPENCISVQNILQKMQERQTALNILLLDTCRKWYNPKCALSEVKPLEPWGNTVYGYATSEDAEAYEVQDGAFSSGIFMKYLKKHIQKEKKVTHMLEEVLEDLGRDPLVKGKQVMEIKHTLKEGRALTDTIRRIGQTDKPQACSDVWTHARELPKEIKRFPCGAEIELCFHAVFSNIMHVYAKLKKVPEHIANARVLLFKPPEMLDILTVTDSRCERVDSLLASSSDREESDSMLRLCGLQKYQNGVVIKIDLHYTNLKNAERMHEFLELNLRSPLVATLFSKKDSDAGSSSSAAHENHSAAAKKDNKDIPQQQLSLHSLCSRPGTRRAENGPNSTASSQSRTSSEPEENDERELLHLALLPQWPASSCSLLDRSV